MMAGMFTLTLNGFLLVLRTRRSLMLENWNARRPGWNPHARALTCSAVFAGN